MNVSHRARALARREQRIVFLDLFFEANSALLLLVAVLTFLIVMLCIIVRKAYHVWVALLRADCQVDLIYVQDFIVLVSQGCYVFITLFHFFEVWSSFEKGCSVFTVCKLCLIQN